MKMQIRIFIWAIPVLLFVLGIFLRKTNTTSFLGLICWSVAVVFMCYFLLHHLRGNSLKLAKTLTTVLTVALSVGLIVAAVTGCYIGIATAGEPEASCQYIVVLGAKVNGNEPSRTLKERIDAAATYLSEHPESIAVVSGGQGIDEGISEAQCMYNGLVQQGIATDRIWMEDKATSTWENLMFSLNLIEEKTGKRPTDIGLLSSEFHLYRGSLLAKDCGVVAHGIPATTENPVYFLNYFLREIAGVWHYVIFSG